jgi:hypothetical protein
MSDVTKCKHMFDRNADCVFCSKSATRIDDELKKARSNAGAFERALKAAVDAGDESARKEYSNPCWGSAGTFSVEATGEPPMLQSLIDAQTRMNEVATERHVKYMEAMARQFEAAVSSQTMIQGVAFRAKPPPMAVDGYELRMQRYVHIMDAIPRVTPRILLDEPPPKPPPCRWCGVSPDVPIDHAGYNKYGCAKLDCVRYDLALKERLYAGANDCPEERDSVRRWVDRQRVTSSCRGCTRPLEQDAHVLFCSDCAVSKPARVAVVTEEPSGWSAWATATDES